MFIIPLLNYSPSSQISLPHPVCLSCQPSQTLTQHFTQPTLGSGFLHAIYRFYLLLTFTATVLILSCDYITSQTLFLSPTTIISAFNVASIAIPPQIYTRGSSNFEALRRFSVCWISVTVINYASNSMSSDATTGVQDVSAKDFIILCHYRGKTVPVEYTENYEKFNCISSLALTAIGIPNEEHMGTPFNETKVYPHTETWRKLPMHKHDVVYAEFFPWWIALWIKLPYFLGISSGQKPTSDGSKMVLSIQPACPDSQAVYTDAFLLSVILSNVFHSPSKRSSHNNPPFSGSTELKPFHDFVNPQRYAYVINVNHLRRAQSGVGTKSEITEIKVETRLFLHFSCYTTHRFHPTLVLCPQYGARNLAAFVGAPTIAKILNKLNKTSASATTENQSMVLGPWAPLLAQEHPVLNLILSMSTPLRVHSVLYVIAHLVPIIVFASVLRIS
ncbi:hypothetical protein D9758_015879 [Tetrapyrgos nigripes]|uniref:Uncharacterized protein n=1 Tax=Tetrapyrgos nigripes TaxID=182062 RepID=A0A8H5CLC7_9AGAR|nr:hypothetical protein D9758_015879 [Tetrapyrgos nigripes]